MSKTMRSLAIGLAASLAALAMGCGSDDDTTTASAGSGGSGGSSAPLVVSAAASLQTALTAYGDQFAGAQVRLSFAGSDQLAAQIREGVKPDVFASANTKLPDALHAEGLVEQPTVFAGNRLVLAVPAKETGAIRDLADVEKAQTKVAIGSATVPIGAYTRKVLGRLPARERDAILANVRSEEPDVKGIVGKLTQGAGDAGFVYITDVQASKGALTAIELPAVLKPSAAYAVAVVKGTKNAEQAKAFIAGLLHGKGQEALAVAGFEPPPSP
jgi:molybdate transport system substrate-binding protein